MAVTSKFESTRSQQSRATNSSGNLATIPGPAMPISDDPRSPQLSFLASQPISDDSDRAPAQDTPSDDEALYDDEAFFDSDTMGRCKSWLTSMIIHLVVIIGLALLTMQGSRNEVVSIHMGTDDFESTMQLEDLNFDSEEWDDLSETAPVEKQVPEELMEMPDDLDLLEEQLAEPIEFSNPLASDADVMQRLARQATADSLEMGSGESSFFGIETTGDSIVYIVDRSGSMEGQRWRDATRELVKSVESLKPDQEFYVYLFSSGCHPMPKMGQGNQMVKATRENVRQFKRWLSRQSPEGSTMPLSSVRRAIRMEPETIFLLTDGQFYDRTGDYLLRRAVLQQNVSDPDDLVINTIAFHCEFGLEMLMDIAIKYDGTFRSVE